MLSRKVFWPVTFALALVGATSGALLGNHLTSLPVQESHAAWKQVFDSPSQLTRGVDAVVLARAVSVAPGRIAYSANGEDALPFQVYDFEVVRGIKGVKAGQRIQVERAGGVAPNGRPVLLDVDGGAYELGATYLLFINRQPESGFFYQVNHQGRYLVVQNRLYAAAPDNHVAGFFEGRPVNEGLGLVRGYVQAN